MQEVEYERMRAVEDEHWWYSVLRAMVTRVVAEHCLRPRAKILDAGCGTGGMLSLLRALHPLWELHGIDIAPAAIECCRRRNLTNIIQGDVGRLPYADSVFDTVLSLDILYHLEVNQDLAMAEMVRVLKPGGLLILNLPAFQALRGSHDVAVCGVRRYRAWEVRGLLERHSLKPQMTHYWNAWLFTPLLAWRQWSRLLPVGSTRGSDLAFKPSKFNHILAAIGRWEAGVCRKTRIPFGTSVFAIAIKPEAQV